MFLLKAELMSEEDSIPVALRMGRRGWPAEGRGGWSSHSPKVAVPRASSFGLGRRGWPTKGRGPICFERFPKAEDGHACPGPKPGCLSRLATKSGFTRPKVQAKALISVGTRGLKIRANTQQRDTSVNSSRETLPLTPWVYIEGGRRQFAPCPLRST